MIFDNILIHKKSHENFWIYDISYKTLIRFDKIDEFIRIYDRTRYLRLFGSEKYDYIYNRVIKVKTKVNSYDSLPVDKTLTLHNVVILIKSVLNKDKNHCYYKIFLEQCSYQLAKKSSQNFFW